MTNELNVLVVEDNLSAAQLICEGFADEGIRVRCANTLSSAKSLLADGPHFDAMILDRNLPDGDGATIATACRESGNTIPIIMVTAKDSVDDRVNGLTCGADDYICKPYDIKELVARLRAVMKRSRGTNSHVLRYSDVELDLSSRRVRRRDLDHTLSARETDLLAFFMLHPEQVLSKERIMNEVWGDQIMRQGNVLHVYANYIRNKLENGRYPRLVHTIRGTGYIMSTQDPEQRLG